MILVDANILVYAHVNSFPQHAIAREWLNQCSARVGLPWASMRKGGCTVGVLALQHLSGRAVRKVVLMPAAEGLIAIWDGEPKRSSLDHDSVHDEPQHHLGI